LRASRLSRQALSLVGLGWSSLLLVLMRKLIGMAQHDFPLAAFPAVGLGAAKRPGLRAIAEVAGHVLQVHGEREIIMDDRHNVLRDAVGRLNALGGPVKAGAHLIPAALVTAECAHDHYVIGM